ncbi:hypothetical protein ACSQ67_010299 [Phaseolus vulgaris]
MYGGSRVANGKHGRGSGVGEGVYGRLLECRCSRLTKINREAPQSGFDVVDEAVRPGIRKRKERSGWGEREVSNLARDERIDYRYYKMMLLDNVEMPPRASLLE